MNVIIVLAVTRWRSWAQVLCNSCSPQKRVIPKENWQLDLSDKIISFAFQKSVVKLQKFFLTVLLHGVFCLFAKALWKPSVASVLILSSTENILSVVCYCVPCKIKLEVSVPDLCIERPFPFSRLQFTRYACPFHCHIIVFPFPTLRMVWDGTEARVGLSWSWSSKVRC